MSKKITVEVTVRTKHMRSGTFTDCMGRAIREALEKAAGGINGFSVQSHSGSRQAPGEALYVNCSDEWANDWSACIPAEAWDDYMWGRSIGTTFEAEFTVTPSVATGNETQDAVQ